MQSKPEARIARPGERERWRGGGAKRRGVAVAWGSAFGRVDELAHGVLGPPSVVPVGLGEGVEAPLEANDGDGEVREAGEIARQVAGSHPAAVFVVRRARGGVDVVQCPRTRARTTCEVAWSGGTEVRPCTVSSTLPVLTMRRSRSMR